MMDPNPGEYAQPMSTVTSQFVILPSSHARYSETFPAAPQVEQELRQIIRGEVRFDETSRALYATDASNYRHIPIGVVIPLDEDDVIATVEICRRHNAPLLSRGGGTSLAGQGCNVAVILDFSKYMNKMGTVDPVTRTVRVQPGIVLDRVREAAEKFALTYAPDPATHSRCTIGGMIGNNSCGIHALMGGKTVDNIHSLDVLLYDGTRLTVGPTTDDELAAHIAAGGRIGEIYAELKRIRDTYAPLVRAKFPNIPRRVSGYNLDELLPENHFNVARALVGSEGTCAVILGATLNLVKSPQFRTLVGVGFKDIFIAADNVPLILTHKPIGLEGVDNLLLDSLRRKHKALDDIALLPEGNGYLIAEFGGDTQQEADDQAAEFAEAIKTVSQPAHLQQGRGRTRLGRARIRPRSHGLRPRRQDRLGGLGGRRRRPRATRLLPARHLRPHGRVRLPQPYVRPLRPGLRPHAPQLRSRNRAGHPQLPRVHGPRRRYRLGSRRLALRRTRRRPVPRRAATPRCSAPSSWKPSAPSSASGTPPAA